jgi:predicted transcriptional regulator
MAIIVHEEFTPEDIAELREEIDAGLADADNGNFADFSAENVIAERRAALAADKNCGRNS